MCGRKSRPRGVNCDYLLYYVVGGVGSVPVPASAGSTSSHNDPTYPSNNRNIRHLLDQKPTQLQD
jgi:hypothetical protein